MAVDSIQKARYKKCGGIHLGKSAADQAVPTMTTI